MRPHHILVWTGLVLAILVPLALAASSPLLSYRSAIYVAAGLFGVLGLCLLLIQPVLAAGALPGLSSRRARRLHQVSGVLLTLCIVIHVAALWITSPPDVIDALLLRSPTPFSLWGVISMIAVFSTGLLALVRKHLRPRFWRFGHRALAVIIVLGTVLHAMLIDGTMETVSKTVLCALVVLATLNLARRKTLWR